MWRQLGRRRRRFLAFRPSKSFVFCCLLWTEEGTAVSQFVKQTSPLQHQRYVAVFCLGNTMGNGNNFHFDISLHFPFATSRLLWKLTTSYFSTTFHPLVTCWETRRHQKTPTHTISTLWKSLLFCKNQIFFCAPRSTSSTTDYNYDCIFCYCCFLFWTPLLAVSTEHFMREREISLPRLATIGWAAGTSHQSIVAITAVGFRKLCCRQKHSEAP